jgi:uncharacterized protein YydD (DUF2326 family)
MIRDKVTTLVRITIAIPPALKRGAVARILNEYDITSATLRNVHGMWRNGILHDAVEIDVVDGDTDLCIAVADTLRRRFKQRSVLVTRHQVVVDCIGDET